MEYVFLIFGTLIAMNIGIVAAVSEPNEATWADETSVEIETVYPPQPTTRSAE